MLRPWPLSQQDDTLAEQLMMNDMNGVVNVEAQTADAIYPQLYFNVDPEEGFESPTITCVDNTRGISVAGLNKELGAQHAMISNGYGKLKEQAFRIAHMGDTQEWEIRGLLATIERILGL